MRVTLTRLSELKEDPQLGALLFNGVPRLVSLELPDRDNIPGKSCIPKGTYKCVETFNRITTGGLHIPRTFEVTGVPGRAGILFHVGNFIKDTTGCILTGQRWIGNGDESVILNSKIAFAEFLELTKGFNGFKLEVK